ncbi:MAG: hexose kinase [Spirochaetes bacterium]|nr:hexose kinase [Spirochaetota bacterium]
MKISRAYPDIYAAAALGRIVTVTLNPVFDRSLVVPGFEKGGTFAVSDSSIVAAGKGVNVSRALKSCAVFSVATGLLPAGGKNAYLTRLDREGIANDFVHTGGNIRTNITILDHGCPGETHLREKGPRLPASALNRLGAKLSSITGAGSTVVFSGSLPAGLSSFSYASLVATVQEKGCRAFLDASGEPLQKALFSRPFFVAPNIDEVYDALGYRPDRNSDLARAIGELHGFGVRYVMITRGKEGIVLSDGRNTVCAKVEVENPVNAVGSGDAALAGSIIGLLGGLDLETTAGLACAFGAANTLSSGAGMLLQSDIGKLSSEVELFPL